ncbi:MAG: S9 family peptidase [Bryobacteraceae bacterium]|nr:S9 family peptidase [Bryobacteraceae bacterium]
MSQLTLAAESDSKPPAAKIVPKVMEHHGDKRVDNYFWLRDRDDPDTIRYLEAENTYTAASMKHTDALQSKLYAEILGRIKETDLSVPVKRDNFYYYSRTEKGKQYPIYCRKKGSLEAPEEILLDANILAEGQKYFQLGNFEISPDHKLLAYSTDTAGDESYTLYIKDVAAGTLLPDRVKDTYYSLEWASDNKTLFYTTYDAARRPDKVWRHELGGAKDTLVYHEPDERFTVGVNKTRSREFILININSSLTTEVRYIRASEPGAPFRPILPRVQDTEYDVEHNGEYFYIRTNDGAKNFRLVRAPIADPSKKNWQELIPGRDRVTIEGIDAFRNHLVAVERDNGLPKIRIRRLADASEHFVDFPEPVYTAVPGGSAEYDTTTLRFSYTSLVTPNSVYDYDMETKKRTLMKRQEVLGGYDPSQYTSERIFAKAPDGVEVPVSLVYKKGFARNGKAPALLYGYGSYGLNSDPTFASDRLSLLDRGFVFAIAHIRGGADLGKFWHDDGKMMKKKNTFTDFIAAAEALIAGKYTSSNRLAIMGGSAGGLLMGAVVTLRPDLFHAVVAKVPYVDNLNTGLDATLPLTVGEYEEWGNAEKDKTYYDYIKSYSPYENTGKLKYPNMLVTGGLNDPRVSYWEPAKWVAKMRAVADKGSGKLLLKTNMGAGHFGASGRYERIKETAFDYAFLLDMMGIKE